MNEENKVTPRFSCPLVDKESDNDYKYRLTLRITRFANACIAAERREDFLEVVYATLAYDQANNGLDTNGLCESTTTALDGTQYAFPALPRLTKDFALSPEVIKAYAEGGKIQAIKALREETCMGLKEAKDWIEYIAERDGLVSEYEQKRDQESARQVKIRALLTEEEYLALSRHANAAYQSNLSKAKCVLFLLTNAELAEVGKECFNLMNDRSKQ